MTDPNKAAVLVCEGDSRIGARIREGIVMDENKAAVLAKWPDAHLNTVIDIYKRTVFQIKATRFFVSGSFFSESEAWADAARRLK